MDNQRIQSQIGVSISLARNLVASWLPPATEEEKKLQAQNAKTQSNLVNDRRRPGAGLGSTAEKDESAQLSLEELKIKRRLLQKDKKVKEHQRELLAQKAGKKHKSLRADPSSDEDDDNEHERKGKGNLQKKQKTTTTSFDKHKIPGEKKAAKDLRGFGR